MITKGTWLLETTPLYRGVRVFSIAGMLYGCGLGAANPEMELIEILYARFQYYEDPHLELSLAHILLIVIAFGYFLFWEAIKEFARILNEQDSRQVKRIGLGAFLSIVAPVLSCIPNMLVGDIVANLIGISAAIIMMQAYFALNKSQTFPRQSAIAAKQLAISYVVTVILYLIELTLSLIFSRTIELTYDKVIYIVEMIVLLRFALSILLCISIITSWKKIKTTDPQNYPDSNIIKLKQP
ncbi:MAG: hypothetical protein LBK45_03115 [Tannerellaceae bacterium]|jgi:hypothetical protein|nr:hypothetical protein [Tannerellaceae bacterium]